MGLDILNSVQPYVAQMDHQHIKEAYGDRLAFHGGIDIQDVLPDVSPENIIALRDPVLKFGKYPI